MKINITKSAGRLTEHEINQFEERLGTSIPLSYRDFLLNHNGGKPDLSEFSILSCAKGSANEGSVVKCFLGINMAEETFNLDYVLDTFRDRLPSDIFPIARDPGGNLICIATEGANLGKIYFWDHEAEVEEGDTPNYDNISLIADNFQEFMAKLS
jgi:hypothetical protein